MKPRLRVWDATEFALHHNKISRYNLILDTKGKLQALVDWKCVSVRPKLRLEQILSFAFVLKSEHR